MMKAKNQEERPGEESKEMKANYNAIENITNEKKETKKISK